MVSLVSMYSNKSYIFDLSTTSMINFINWDRIYKLSKFEDKEKQLVKSKQCEKILADFCSSESLSICFFYIKKADFQNCRSAKVC